MTNDSVALPSLTVIIPVYNSEDQLDACLKALSRSQHRPEEVIVVDDASTDQSAAVAAAHGVQVIRRTRNAGPAAARNAAAEQASGDVLVFLDADTEIHTDALAIIARRFASEPRLDAVFGSYDDSPSDPGIVSRFRNLLHCDVHRHAPRTANTFWAGCGAVRRSVFRSSGGFNESHATPSTEDVELGMTLARQGRRIEVDPSIQVKHLKRWTVRTMVFTDVFRRAVPLAELMIQERAYPRVLGFKQLLSAVLVTLLLAWLEFRFTTALAVCSVSYLALNLRFLQFLSSRGGARFAMCGILLLAVHHLSGALGISMGAARYAGRRIAASPPALGATAFAALLAWYGLTVSVNYDGNWTALFCTGATRSVPPELDAATHRSRSDSGYDGQFYRLVAHDPLLTRGYAQYADSPAVRWRRILVPALAWGAALGDPARIDAAYIFVVLLWSAIGVYALSRWLSVHSRNPAAGLLFLILPGTLISIDRLTVDVALYSLLFLCLLWDEQRRNVALWIGLALAALTRDLGFLLIGSFFLAEAAARRFGRAFAIASAAAPAVVWYLFVRTTLSGPTGRVPPEVARWAFREPGYGIVLRMFNPGSYDLPSLQAFLATALDEFALAGLLACVILTLVLFRWRAATKLEWVGLCFALLFFAASSELFWRDLFSWPRAYTPMLAALAFSSRTAFRNWAWIPLAAVTLRVGLQFGAQFEGVLQAIRAASRLLPG